MPPNSDTRLPPQIQGIADLLLTRPQLRGMTISAVAMAMGATAPNVRAALAAIVYAAKRIGQNGSKTLPPLERSWHIERALPLSITMDQALAKFGSNASPTRYSPSPTIGPRSNSAFSNSAFSFGQVEDAGLMAPEMVALAASARRVYGTKTSAQPHQDTVANVRRATRGTATTSELSSATRAARVAPIRPSYTPPRVVPPNPSGSRFGGPPSTNDAPPAPNDPNLNDPSPYVPPTSSGSGTPDITSSGTSTFTASPTGLQSDVIRWKAFTDSTLAAIVSVVDGARSIDPQRLGQAKLSQLAGRVGMVNAFAQQQAMGFGGDAGSIDRKSKPYGIWVQQNLNQQLDPTPGLQVDGKLGSLSIAAIKRYQGENGLFVDGLMGSNTESVMQTLGASPPPGGVSVTGGDGVVTLPTVVIFGAPTPVAGPSTINHSPAYISWVQSSLNLIDHEKLFTTGQQDQATTDAIKRFQSAAQIGVDGTVGPITETAMVKAGAPPPPGAPGAAPPALLSNGTPDANQFAPPGGILQVQLQLATWSKVDNLSDPPLYGVDPKDLSGLDDALFRRVLSSFQRVIGGLRTDGQLDDATYQAITRWTSDFMARTKPNLGNPNPVAGKPKPGATSPAASSSSGGGLGLLVAAAAAVLLGAA